MHRRREPIPAAPTSADSPMLWVVLLILPVRFVGSFVAQGAAAVVLWAAGDPTPWASAAGWWTVSGTLTDVLCLLALAWAMRREGGRLRDLVVLGDGGIRAQLTAIPRYLLCLLPFAAAHDARLRAAAASARHDHAHPLGRGCADRAAPVRARRVARAVIGGMRGASLAVHLALAE